MEGSGACSAGGRKCHSLDFVSRPIEFKRLDEDFFAEE
jgi:hypothetical protein